MALISITWPVLAVGATRAPVMYSTLLRSLADGSHFVKQSAGISTSGTWIIVATARSIRHVLYNVISTPNAVGPTHGCRRSAALS